MRWKAETSSLKSKEEHVERALDPMARRRGAGEEEKQGEADRRTRARSKTLPLSFHYESFLLLRIPI
jgi:hypothetical protein